MRVRMTTATRLAFAAATAAFASAALAQEPGREAYYAAADAADQAAAPTPEDSALLGQALNFDPSSLASVAPTRALKLPALKRDKTFDVSRTNEQADGSGTVVVKQALSTEWDAKVGADIGIAGNAPAAYYQPLSPQSTPSSGGNSGAAWASVGLSSLATVDARVDPTTDQGRLAGTLKHSMPVGGYLSMTLQNSTSVTDTFGPQSSSAPAQVFGNEQSVKFDVLSTGTSFSAGVTTASNDPVARNKLSAEQKLLGPLHITTSVSDVGQPTVNKSITGGFKLNW